MLCRYSLGLPAAAGAIERAVADVLAAGHRTADLAAPGERARRLPRDGRGSCASGSEVVRCGDLRVAVVGAAGLVGREILRLLDERAELAGRAAAARLAAHGRRHGSRTGGIEAHVDLLRPGAFDGIDVAFFAAGPAGGARVGAAGGASRRGGRSTSAAASGSTRRCRSSCPEVNAEALASWRERGIVASPSSTAVGSRVVLAPLAATAGLRRVVVVDLLRASASAGRRAVDGLVQRDASIS